MIALPLQREARINGNSSFVDSDLNLIGDQWQFLGQMQRLNAKELSQLLSRISPGPQLLKEQNGILKIPPRELTAKQAPLLLQDVPTHVTLKMADRLYLELSTIPTELAARLRRLASFSNPVFFKTQGLRFSTHGIPRFISCARIEQ